MFAQRVKHVCRKVYGTNEGISKSVQASRCCRRKYPFGLAAPTFNTLQARSESGISRLALTVFRAGHRSYPPYSVPSQPIAFLGTQATVEQKNRHVAE